MNPPPNPTVNRTRRHIPSFLPAIHRRAGYTFNVRRHC
jgi:hypothetical protein